MKFSGVTTMYGNDDNGTGTASGRRFEKNEFTCAHKTLPFWHAAGGQQGREERHRDGDRSRSVHAWPDA